MLSDFTKPPLPTAKLLDLIRSRGMQIEDDMLAAIGREQQFKSKMTQLFRAHPKVPRDKMGFNPEIIRELGYE